MGKRTIRSVVVAKFNDKITGPIPIERGDERKNIRPQNRRIVPGINRHQTRFKSIADIILSAICATYLYGKTIIQVKGAAIRVYGDLADKPLLQTPTGQFSGAINHLSTGILVCAGEWINITTKLLRSNRARRAVGTRTNAGLPTSK